jgi:glutamate transport system substrate-binding protein
MRTTIKLAAALCMAVGALLGIPSRGANAASFPAGSKMAQLSQLGKIKVGTQTQYPLIGMKTLSGYEGFDVEIAKLIAKKLGISESNIEFVPVTTPTREPFLQQNKVDIIVAAYTITPSRWKVIDFAGPYLPSPSGLMVKAGNPLKVKSFPDMEGKRLCAPSGSSQEAYLSQHFPKVRETAVLFDSSAKCAQAVINGQADASTTDIPILAALAQQNEGKLEVIDFQYDSAFWGVGLPKTEDKAFCQWINNALNESYSDGSWANAYKKTIGTVVPGPVPMPPKTSNCAEGG